jgi:formylglycine-generating enzyme required for sulfatase activity
MLAERRPGPGTRLNGIYEIDELIATGGMGEIYRGRALETGSVVAIKMIRRDFAENQRVLALFRKEAAALYRLQHEAIVRYYVFTTDPDLNCPYLAMEFVEGESLLEVARRKPFDVEAVLVLMARIAAGLHAAHEEGVIHRDVSPDNIILPGGDPARAKIIDFGIARSALDGSTVIGSDFAGKANFVSPEQIGLFGGVITAKSDIYGLGLTLAAALLGGPLDMAGTHVEVVAKRQVEPDLSAIDPRLRPILRAMLQPKPEDRPATMAEIAAWRPGTVPRPQQSRTKARRWPLIAAGLATGVLGLAGLGAWQAGLLQSASSTPSVPQIAAAPARATVPPPASSRSGPAPQPTKPPQATVPAGPAEPAAAVPAAAPPYPGHDANPASPPTAAADIARPVGAPGTSETGTGAADSGDSRAFRDCSTCPEMVRIPGGTFTMGSTLDPTERPTRRVSVKPFAIGRHPVTLREWKACVQSGKCTPVADGPDNAPVHNLSWSDGQDYVAWLSDATGMPYRLPSEAEWEYAARAGSTTRYWWGDGFRTEMSDCRRCGPPALEPKPVGRYPTNAFGLGEISGSVAQWVADCWAASFRGAPTDGSARVKEGCRDRVLRGGSWMMDPAALRVSTRAFYDASVRYTGHGLRVARPL